MNWANIFTNDIMWIILAFVVVICFVYLYNLNNDDKSDISLVDLVTVDGKLNDRKLQRFGAWIVSTWGFIYLITIDKLSEWYFIGYMGAWVANALIGKMIKDPNNDDNRNLSNKENHERKW